jgi:hypothetical protein
MERGISTGSLAASLAAIAIAAGGSCLADQPGGTASTKTNGRWLIDRQSNCAVFDTKPREADAVSWAGDCANGLASGQGTVTYYGQGKFVGALTGNFDNGALKDGTASERWADGSYFQGSEAGGQIKGAGVLSNAQGDRFEGQWTDNRLNGRGRIAWANGDRYEGELRDSKADGHGVQIWADGHRYEGEWRNDLPNGHGVLTAKDGSAREGEFADGQLKEPPSPLADAKADAAPPRPPSPPTATASVQASNAQSAAKSKERAPSETPRANSPWLEAVAGQRLVAVDGSAIVLSLSEDGFARELVALDGSAQKTSFTFLNDKQGAVANASDAVVGLFRVTEQGFEAQYADGHSETLTADASLGLAMASRPASGDGFCRIWYPAGHAFTDRDRQAALAEYASRLGLTQARAKKQATGCAPAAAVNVADDHGKPDAAAAAPASPRGVTKRSRSRHGASAKTAELQDSDRWFSTQPIAVRTSIVHLVDKDAPAAPPAPIAISFASAAAAQPPDKPAAQAGASSCLSIENDGGSWGFRNRCGYSVQFAYCIANGDDPATSCTGGFAAGGVAANGFGALLSERAIANVEHDFRWIGCSGASGEVTPRLLRADPPAGRCDRAS